MSTFNMAPVSLNSGKGQKLPFKMFSLVILPGVALCLICGCIVLGVRQSDLDVLETTYFPSRRELRPTRVEPVVVKPDKSMLIHVVSTSNGSPYLNFQTRIMYGTFKMVQQMPGGDKMAGFTRILHRMTDDALMAEIPTFRAQPLHPECDNWCSFPVADRPNAVRQWLEAVARGEQQVQGDWILLIEGDYVFMKPTEVPGAAGPSAKSYGYMFGYITPTYPRVQHIIRRLSDGLEPGLVPQSGPAPVLMPLEHFVKVVPGWESITAAIEADSEAVEVLGWVREMYAWCIAVAKHRDITMEVAEAPASTLIAQPPADKILGNASMLHYTWGIEYYERGNKIWTWDKRLYTSVEVSLKVPLIPMPPEFKAGWVSQSKERITQDTHDLIAAMLTQMNKAIEQLPDLSSPT